MSSHSNEKVPPVEVAKMTKVQKLAALLVVLGPDSAAGILKNLDEQELESITGEMARLNFISLEMQRDLLREFTEVAVHASTATRGGMEFVQAALEKSVGPFRASNIASRVAPSSTPVASMQQIVEMEARHIFNLVKAEQPQTIALVASYLSPEKGSQLLLLLKPESRDQVVEKLARMEATPIEVVERVVEVLNRRLRGQPTRALNQTGGVKPAADMLNAMDKNLSKSLLAGIEERSPELGAAIRQKMFTFEDLVLLDGGAIQKILREIEMRDLAVALKTASEKLKGVLLACISKRAAETVSEEISFMGRIKPREVEAAQTRIIDAVRRLESEGEIELGNPNEKVENEVMA